MPKEKGPEANGEIGFGLRSGQALRFGRDDRMGRRSPKCRAKILRFGQDDGVRGQVGDDKEPFVDPTK